MENVRNPENAIEELASELGYIEFQTSVILVDKGITWYLLTEEKDLGEGGDLCFKRMFVALGPKGVYSYADGIEFWGRSLGTKDFYLAYPLGSPEQERLMEATTVLCPVQTDRVSFAEKDIENELINKHHVILIINELALPLGIKDVFENNEAYREFLNVVKTAYISHRGRVVMALDDPATAYANDMLKEAGEEAAVLQSIRCELL